MSYEFIASRMTGRLEVPVWAVLVLADDYEDSLPETNFLGKLLEVKDTGQDTVVLDHSNFSWQGHGSLKTVDLEALLAITMGEADIFLIDDEGHVVALTVRDGTVMFHDSVGMVPAGPGTPVSGLRLRRPQPVAKPVPTTIGRRPR